MGQNDWPEKMDGVIIRKKNGVSMCALFVYEPNLFQDARIPFGLLVKSNVTSEKEKKQCGLFFRWFP